MNRAKKGLQFLGRWIKANPLGMLGESGNVFPDVCFLQRKTSELSFIPSMLCAAASAANSACLSAKFRRFRISEPFVSGEISHTHLSRLCVAIAVRES